MAEPKLTEVNGIGPKTAQGLATMGIDSVKTLVAAPVELIATLPGFSVGRAQKLKDEAVQHLRPAKASAPARKATAKTAGGETEATAAAKKKKKTTKKKEKKADEKKKTAKKHAAKDKPKKTKKQVKGKSAKKKAAKKKKTGKKKAGKKKK